MVVADERELKEREVEEILKEAEDLRVDGIIPDKVVAEKTKGYTLVKEYDYGRYGDITVSYYRKGGKKLFTVKNNATGAYKLITESFKEADAVARGLSTRYKKLEGLFL